MGKRIDPIIEEVLERYAIDPRRALWDCHGTWVIYHKYVELIGMKAGIKLAPPKIIHSDPASKHVIILVEGQLGAEMSTWSFGEASPYNNKNAYPYAMAEKRGKDRVILKLVGLAGHVYTDQDVADIKDGKIQWEVKEEPLADVNMGMLIKNCTTTEALDEAAQKIAKMNLNDDDKARLRKSYMNKRKELSNG